MLAEADPRLHARSSESEFMTRNKRAPLTPGYVTHDDLGSDGNGTPHSAIPSYPLPVYVQVNASFPSTGKPVTVDLVFLDYIQSDMTDVLSTLGVKVSDSQVKQYLPKSFTTNSYLPLYAKEFWSKGPVCPVGQGVQ